MYFQGSNIEEVISKMFFLRERFQKCILQESSFENVFSREQNWGSNFKDVFFEGEILKCVFFE